MIVAILVLASARPVTLAPSGPWNVEAQENMCLLSRPFGTGPNEAIVGFQPLFDNETMEVMVLDHAARTSQRAGGATIELQPGDKKYDGTFYSVPTKDGRRYARLTIDSAVWQALPGASIMHIKAGRLDTTVTIEKLNKALPVFNACQARLLQSWGVDPATLQEGRSPKIQGNPGRYFSPESYPKEALSAGIIGRVITVLNVDRSGSVVGCKVVASAGKLLNDATCKAAMHLRFRPGRDASGVAASSIAVLPVRWDMP